MTATLSVPVSEIFSPDQLSNIDPDAMPRHVAIIPDGNRRWAEDQHQESGKGHWVGADILFDVVKGARDLGIEVVTVYGFSTENWKRKEEEIDELIQVIESYLRNKREAMVEHGVRLQAIGDLERFPPSLREELDRTRRATEHCSRIELVLALNYGGRDDLRRAMKRMLELNAEGNLTPDDLDESIISQFLDTARWPDPDLLIRTSGEMRVSNFLLWQLSYAEIHVTDVLWPNFRPAHLLEAVQAYQERQRRGGQ